MSTQIEFQTKKPHRETVWLHVRFPEGDEPLDLIKAMGDIGWAEDKRFGRLPVLNGFLEIDLSRRGSALFGGWTNEETTQFMREARAALTKLGIKVGPVRAYTQWELE